MKRKVNKLCVDKFSACSWWLSKLINVVKKDVVKKSECFELVKKFNNINTTDTTSNLVKKKTDYNTEINEIEKKLLIMIILIIYGYTRIS